MKAGVFGLLFLAAMLLAPGVVSAQKQLRVVYHPNRDNKLALWVAEDAGFFKKNGLEVILMAEPRTGEDTVKAVLSREIEIGVMGFRDAVRPLTVTAGADVAFIASLAANPFVFLAHPDIKSPQDLKGKKIWTARFGRGPDVATRVVLRYLRIDPERDVRLISCSECSVNLTDNPSVGVRWIFDGKVAASLANRGALRDLEKEGKRVTVLADFIEAGLYITAADVMVQTDWLRANREAAKSFLRALVEATAYAKKNKDFTNAVLKKYLLKEFATGMETKFEDFVLGVLPKKPYPLAKGLEIAIQEKAPGHAFFQNKKASDFIDESLMREIENEGLFERLYR